VLLVVTDHAPAGLGLRPQGFLCPRQLPAPVPLVLPLHPTVPPLLPVLEEDEPLELVEVVLESDVLPPVDELLPLVLEVVPELDTLPVLEEDEPFELEVVAELDTLLAPEVVVEPVEPLVVDGDVLPDELVPLEIAVVPEVLVGCLDAASTRLVDTAAPASARSFATTAIWSDWLGSDQAAVVSVGEPPCGSTTLDVADCTVSPGSPSA
jgi:hypothetical protein